MAIADTVVLSDIQRSLLETVNSGASYSSQQWTAAEVIGYLNNRQDQFLKDSGILLKRATVNTLPSVLRHALPSDWIMTQRIAWESLDSVFTEVPRGDGWEADHVLLDWPYNQDLTKPAIYTDGEVPTLEFETFPGIGVSGILHVLYAYVGTTLTGGGVNMSVPDEFVPAIKWGVVEDMLSKVGRAQDPDRAAYAKSRYDEGVAAAKAILAGWK